MIPTEDSIAVGKTTQFNALGSFSDDSTTDVTATVTWTSSDTTIATVSSGGLATGVAAGTVTITATDPTTDLSATATLMVTAAAPPPPPPPAPPPPTPTVVVTLLSLSVIPAEDFIAIGETTQFNALGSFSDDSMTGVTATVTWTSSDTTIATVSSGGLATGVEAGTVTITATDPTTELSATTTLTVTSAEQLRSPPQPMTVEIIITVSTEQFSNVTEALSNTLGEGVAVVQEPLEIISEERGVVVSVSLTGHTAGQGINGDLDLTLGNLVVNSTNGTGTATIDLQGGLSVQGDASLQVTADGIDVVIEDPHLIYEPEAPDTTALLGGSASVTEIGVVVNLELTTLPNNASISVQFALDASAFVANPGATFRQAAQGVGGILEDPVEDVGFVANFTKTVITNQHLGANDMTMLINEAWHAEKVTQGKAFHMTKIDDEGNVFTRPATCDASSNPVRCKSRFENEAGGLSVFALIAVAPAPTPTPTPTPPPVATPTATSVAVLATPTATPTTAPGTPTVVPPTSTPTSTPTPPVVASVTPAPTPTAAPAPSDGAPIISIVLGIALLLIAAGAAYYFLVMRRGGGEATEAPA